MLSRGLGRTRARRAWRCFATSILVLDIACCPPGRVPLNTPDGKVCVAEWVVDFVTCIRHSQDYSHLSTEQRRRINTLISTLGVTAESEIDFGTTWEARFHERPSDAIRKIADTCTDRTAPKDVSGATERRNAALIATGGSLLAISAASIGLLIAGSIIVKNAEDRFHTGQTLDDRQSANQRGKQGEALIAAGGITAALLLPTGLALVIVGKTGQRHALTVIPSVDRHMAGLRIGGTF